MTPVFRCPCCGGEMRLEKEERNAVYYRCSSCGLTEVRLKQSP